MYEYFPKYSYDVTFFFPTLRQYNTQQCFFVHIALVFEARLKPNAASVT